MRKGLVNRWLCVLLSFVLSASLFPADALAEVVDDIGRQEPEVVLEEPADELEEESEDDEANPEVEDDSTGEEVPVVDDASPDDEGVDEKDVVTLEDPANPEDGNPEKDEPADDQMPEDGDPGDGEEAADEEPAPEEDVVIPDDPANPEADEPTGDEEAADDESAQDESDEDEAEETDPEATDETDDEKAEPTDEAEDTSEDESDDEADSDEDELTPQDVTPKTDSATGFQYVVNSEGTTVSLYKYVGTPTNGKVVIPLRIDDKFVTSIGNQCFMDNDKITTVICDNSYSPSTYRITDVANEAFMNCPNLTRVELPSSVVNLGTSCFAYTPKLNGLNLLGANWYGNTSDVDYSFSTRNGMQLKGIGNYCFRESGIEVAYFPSGAIAIGRDAFADCTRLVRVSMSESGITYIGEGAFSNCTKLKEITIPRSVYDIPKSCFYGCASLERAYAYDGITKVGQQAFYGCKKLKEFGMPGSIKTAYGAGKKLKSGTFQYDSDTTGTTVGTIYLKEIGNRAFLECQEMTRFNFCEGLTSIGEYAFLRCYDLESATLPDTVESIGRTAFSNCKSLTSFSFPSNANYTTIKMETISYCTAITVITVPSNVTYVERWAFHNMTALEKAYFYNANTKLDIHTTDHYSPFFGCDGEKTVVYGPTGGTLQSNAETCKSYGQIKQFVAPATWFKVTFYKDAAKSESKEKTYSAGAAVTLPGMSEFGSWKYTEGGKSYGLYGWSRRAGIVIKDGIVPTDVYTLGQGVTIDNDAPFYAVYSSDVAMVNVTFHNPKAASEGYTVQVAADSRLTLPNCKTTTGKDTDGKTGWVFTNWSVPGVGSRDPGSAITVPSSDTTITAQFSTTYKVIFDASGTEGQFVDGSKKVKKLELYTDAQGYIGNFPETYYPGYVIEKWTASYMGTTVTESTNFGQLTAQASHNTITVYPKFKKGTNPKITFDASPGKIGSSTTKTVTTNSLFMLNQSDIPTPTALSGYKFNGWAIVNPNGSQQVIGDLVSRIWNSDTTLYADWTKLVTKIALNKTSATVAVGKTLQLKATVTPSDAENTAVTWKSSNTGVATITSGGKVTAKAVGTATITVTAKDGSGKKATCKVTVTKPVSSLSITAPAAQTYTGKALKPKPTVKDGTTKLAEGTHYTLSYKNNVNAGTATVTVTGKGNYTGSKAVTFKINQATISKATFAAVANKTYTGSPIKPEPKVTFGGKTLVKGTDYTLSYKNNVNVGKATITATGRGNFKGTKSLTFTIVQADISKATVAAIADCPYAGSPIKPSPKVTYSGKTLAKVSDYEVSYKNNVKVSGKAQVVLTGKGNFKGTKVVKFRIAFNDVPKAHKFYDKIHRANDLGIINGYGGSEYGKFGPSNNITRGQIAVILWNAAGKPKPGSGAKSFPDVPADAYYTEAIAWASSKGVVNGYLNGNYGPNDYITRQQLAVMVANYAKNVSGKKVVGSAADLAGIPDAAEVADYAVISVAWCYKNNILILQGDKLNAKLTADRATAAQMAVDLYDLVH